MMRRMLHTVFKRILAVIASKVLYSFKKVYKFLSSIFNSIHPSHSIQLLLMSFSKSSTIPMRRKRTITLSEHVTENGDPLVVKKKAREAASATKKTTQVFFLFYPRKKSLTI